MLLKEINPIGGLDFSFDFWFYLTFILHDQNHVYNPDLPPQSEYFTVTFLKSNIKQSSSTEWNVPCTNTEVTDNVGTERGCWRVRGSQQPGCVFKHWGQYKRSSLTTTQKPVGISAEMIPLPASVQRGSLNTARGQITFSHFHRGEWRSVNEIILQMRIFTSVLWTEWPPPRC